jgi:methylase of polypeptide subunit release factors
MLILTVTWLVGKMAGYKKQLFDHLGDNVRSIVEVGVGTGPNLKFYGGRSHIEKVIGVDPNERMARFAEQAALDVGLAPSQFEFLHGVQWFLSLSHPCIYHLVPLLKLTSQIVQSVT